MADSTASTGAAAAAAPVITLAVGSTNPVKAGAVASSFAKCFPDAAFDVQEFKVPSGVSDQPMTDKETRQGAINRARAAAAAFAEKNGTSPRYAIGLEGGVCEDSDGFVEAAEHMVCYAWMAVTNAHDQWGFARTASMPLPPAVATLIRGGMELGHADDKVFGRSNSKQKDGSVGLFTKGLIDRTAYYDHALVLALVPFMNPAMFGVTDDSAAAASGSGAGAAAETATATA